jgi:hypothetical protein
MEGLQDFKGISGKISYKPFVAGDMSCRQGQKHRPFWWNAWRTEKPNA